MQTGELINWLLEGDLSIQYQVRRDLLGEDCREIQARITEDGWGKKLLAARRPDGHWGGGFYRKKWISTHYTLLDLRYLEPDRDNPQARASVSLILDHEKGPDGGINPARTIEQSDVCVNGMFLTYGCYFKASEPALQSIIDFIIEQQIKDGGFNCEANRMAVRHSSLHSTISILEGLLEYKLRGYSYRIKELDRIAAESREFVLKHRLYLSDRTSEVINRRFLMLSYPSRWKYDVLRALVYFQQAGAPYDERMQPALDILAAKRRKDGTWPVQARHPGKVHFEMEKTGGPSRWNTLRALRVLGHFMPGWKGR